jgi:hypothetical protein
MKFRDFKNDRYFQEYLRKKKEQKRLAEERRKKRIIQENRERQMRYQLFLQQQRLSQIGEFASTSAGAPETETIPIVTGSLVFHIDAGDTNSYPGSGTTVSDLVGSNDATLNNGTSFTSADGGSFIFDGMDDYISIPDNDVFSFGNSSTDSPFTFEAWINPTDATDFRILAKFASGVREYFLSTSTDDTIICVLYDYSSDFVFEYAKTTSTLSDGQWANVAVTYDGRGGAGARNGIEIYINGQIQTVTRVFNGTYTAMKNGFQPVDIGRFNATSFASGKLSVLKVYDRDLTASEVLQNYNALSSRYT